ncbi:MAG: peroxiredoxin [Pseudobdellovibrio sp.]
MKMVESQIKVGEVVSDFSAKSSSGNEFLLSNLIGKKVILYFYPKDDTPGCTLQGRDFTRLKSTFAELNTVVVGVSRDNLNSHQKFIDKCELGIELLSDEDEKLCRMFDVIKEKDMYGKKVLGIERSTFVIDENQTLIAEFRKVSADGHAEQLISFLRERSN